MQRVLQAADGEASAQAMGSGAEFEHWIKHGSVRAADVAAAEKGTSPAGAAVSPPAVEV